MRKPFVLLVIAVLMLGSLIGFPACSPQDAETLSPTVLGTYELDGDSYDILSAKSSNDGSYLMFSFSPLAPSSQMTTYAVFGVRLYWLDKEIDIEDVDHNDDYIFMYEDPVRCYSQYRRPLSGNFYVGHNGDGSYTLRVDLVLPDGTPFKLDFTGDC